MNTPASSSSGRVRELLVLALPAVFSYLLGNFYRINDQLWIQGLGGAAQAAIGATMYVAIMNFALYFLAVGGTLALVSRAEGAKRFEERDDVTRHALLMACLLGGALSLIGTPLSSTITGWMGLTAEPASYATQYLEALYLVAIPMAMAPALDHVFIARGNTLVPMLLQVLAIALNFALNPVLIYGVHAADSVSVPGASLAAAAAGWFEFEGLGMRGAALATGASRALTVLLGLAILCSRYGFRPFGSSRLRPRLFLAIARVSAPMSFTIAVYAGVYWGLLAIVLAELDPTVTAGLGIGFQVYEGVAFPVFLGISVGAASLVGRRLGARDPEGALAFVSTARRVGVAAGIGAMVLFLIGGPLTIAWFTQDSGVREASLAYVLVLAWSQVFVAIESVHEKVLMGAGHTRPIFWISVTGNAARIPLAWVLALFLGLGGAGVWWAINVTTVGKALCLWREVRRGEWLHADPLARAGEADVPDASGIVVEQEDHGV